MPQVRRLSSTIEKVLGVSTARMIKMIGGTKPQDEEKRDDEPVILSFAEAVEQRSKSEKKCN
ncbi:MAG: hypothetical protein HY094_02300 [Candidatus Melainabacteria bacterium]|nr:hypothetical protein [Candidatus Melainabacteria bacterium]